MEAEGLVVGNSCPFGHDEASDAERHDDDDGSVHDDDDGSRGDLVAHSGHWGRRSVLYGGREAVAALSPTLSIAH